MLIDKYPQNHLHEGSFQYNHKERKIPAKTGAEESPQTRVSIVQNHISKIKKKLKNGLTYTHTHTKRIIL